MLKYFFRNSNKTYDTTSSSNRFVDRSNWVPPISLMSEDVIRTIGRIEKTTRSITGNFSQYLHRATGHIRLTERQNLSKDEYNSIHKLRNNSDIIIKQADKGGALVVMNKQDYLTEAYRQLNNGKYYREIHESLRDSNIKRIYAVIRKLNQDGYINDKQVLYLKNIDNIRARLFYILPKIHKPIDQWTVPDRIPTGRPIISNVNSETYRICQYIDYYLAPLANKHASYIKNSYEFIDMVRNLEIPSEALLVTGDISSLYTNMHHDRIINCVKRIFSKFPDETRPDEYLLELLQITLSNNDFEFHGRNYLQICGCPMGINYGPSLANIYLLEFDLMAMQYFKIKPMCYKRYLDDVFFLFVGTTLELIEFEEFLSNIIPDIKISFEYSPIAVNFLDITIYKETTDVATTLQTKVFFKPTDTHQLLHGDSFHPKHTTKGIIQSQLIRYKRLSSTYENYLLSSKILFNALTSRGYTWTQLWKSFKYVWFNHIERTNDDEHRNNNKEITNNLLPIVVPYNTLGKKLATNYKRYIKENMDLPSCRIITAYTNHDNLRKLLVRNRVHPDLTYLNTEVRTNIEDSGATAVSRDDSYTHRPIRGIHYFTKCNDARCLTCILHAAKTNTFTSTRYKTIHRMQQNLNCKSTSVIYLITCRVCKLQYVGETGRSLATRMTEHRSTTSCLRHTPVGLHFSAPNHSFTDIEVVAIEQVGPNDSNEDLSFEQKLANHLNDMTVRKTREKYWQIQLGTIHPQGLNNMRTDINIEG